VFYTGKKDGGRHLVIDYRQLNLITIPDLYPIPTMKRLTDEIEKANLFTTLDLRGGYNNIRVRKGDEWKAAFRTFEGEYKSRVMQFGQVNAPAVFQ
jgi:Reverse transcriptase (RNA-dependent DNA polymerase)